jgi:hypothetical protein
MAEPQLQPHSPIPTVTRPPRPQGSIVGLMPREHGAWGQLLAPMLTGLLQGHGVTLVGICFVAAGISAFLSHEPVTVLLGRRGKRSDAPLKRRALMMTLFLLGAGLVAALTALWSAAPLIRHCALLPTFLGTGAAVAVWLDRERELLAELWLSSTLSALSFPVAVACGVPLLIAAGSWIAWTLASAASIPAVRGVIASFKAQSAPLSRCVGTLFAIISLGLTASLDVVPPSLLASTLPMLVVSAWLGLSPPHPRHLRRVGWTLVGATVLMSLWLIAAGRTIQ